MIVGWMAGLALAMGVPAENARAGDRPAGATAAGPVQAGAVAVPSPPAWGIAVNDHILVTPDRLDWKDGPSALPVGAKMAVVEGDPKARDVLFTVRLRLPANYMVMPHRHLADEHVTVLSGRFDMGIGDRFDPAQLNALPAGSFMVMPAGSNHFAMTRSETEVQVHGVGPWAQIYVNPNDDPRNQARR
jgi:mannose-6-phosphate isomerase-like protein (cupin superfamily)